MIIISYDISDNKLRTRFAKYLNKFGHRLQYSVFEIDNSPHIIDNISVDINNKFAKRFTQSDSVMIFRITDSNNIIRYGYAKNDNETFFVIK